MKYGGKALTKLGYRVTLLACLLLLVISSHNGGSIAHGENYLTKFMPNPLRAIFGLKIEEVKLVHSVDDLVVYSDVFHNIFEQNCNTCHNPNKKKGELNMETYEELLKGGEMGYSIAVGDLEDSELYFRITLPNDDEDFMPTDGKPALTDTEVEVVGWWIMEGADPIKKVGEHGEIPPAVYAYFQKAFDSMVSEEELEKRVDVLKSSSGNQKINVNSVRQSLLAEKTIDRLVEIAKDQENSENVDVVEESTPQASAEDTQGDDDANNAK